MKGLDWRAWCGRLWLRLLLLLGALWFSGASHASWDQDLYRQLGLAGKLDKQVFRQALDGYQKVRHKRKPILTIIDYSKPSTMRRLFVIDVKRHKLLYHTWVSHGRNSGELAARQFSNQMNSRQSSLGVYRTAETYQGKHGYSLRLDGLSPGKNSNARKRAIVVHGADYASPKHLRKFDKLGRSWGCPALPREQSRAIIDTIKGGSVIYAHG
ncbi:murein L,D-transpeptidase catalytic domain family protein [Aeromonas sp. XH]|uniref:murein L,D-transpeptidase catalytic domain family protein n=1 Tax=Aeromonas sp. XH TaxID=3081770 RepID=UPI002967768A|nr:murein L,D-transpeptidase catalytic domain family protein [Aeromonas sp. XH]WOX49214.1 murein L,D-transpeptidase catalytic domain family protein [Aeromonas sp. XH]